MKEIFKKYKIFINVAIYLLLLCFIFFFVISPMLKSIDNRRNDIQKIILDQESQEKRIAQIPEFEKKHDELMKESDRINFFLTEDKAIELIKDIEDFAQQTGNDIVIEFQKKDNDQIIKKHADSKKENEEKKSILNDLPEENFIQLNIRLKGSFNSLVNFLEKIEAMKYYSNVVSLDLKREEETDQENENESGNSVKVDAPAEKFVLNSSINILFYIKK